MTYTTVYIWLNAILDDDIIKNTRPFQSVIIQLTNKFRQENKVSVPSKTSHETLKTRQLLPYPTISQPYKTLKSLKTSFRKR